MAFRKVLFWMHLAAGSTAGVVILIMSVTGTLLMYERQMTAWADGYSLTPSPGAPRLPIETLAGRVREARKEPISSITVRREPSAPVAFGLGREVTLFVDPYSGEILGEGSKRARAFFHEVTDWHRFLG
ncbi:MAG TPA: PepSY-associated TM helix domain-containing protein, partial [Vicinamibacteria bacterium]